MGFSTIDQRVTYDPETAGAVIHCNFGTQITLSGNRMFAGCFGFYQSLNWYFLCAVNGRDGYVLQRENSDGGEGWFLYDWWDRPGPEDSTFDAAVRDVMTAFDPALKGKYLHRIAPVQPRFIDPTVNEHCLAIQRAIDGIAECDAWIL